MDGSGQGNGRVVVMTAMTNNDGHENDDDIGPENASMSTKGKVHPRTLQRHTEVSTVLELAHLHRK